jgi:hypothetical protein
MESQVPIWVKQMMPELREISKNKFKIIGRYAGDFAKDLTYWCQKRGDYDSKVIYEKGDRIILINEEICSLLKTAGLRRIRV